MIEYEWELVELGPHPLVCASGCSRSLDDAKREAAHYAIQYAQDGPVRYTIRCGEEEVLSVSMCLTA